MSNDNIVECSHCLLKINKNLAIKELIDSEEHYFCCPGCKSVYQTIKNGGFFSFYHKRTDYISGAVVPSEVSEDLFKNDIKVLESNSEVTFLLTNIRCAACIWLIENYLKKIDGVVYIRLNYAMHIAKLRWDRDKIKLQEILDAVTSIGYCPLPMQKNNTEDILQKEKKEYLLRFGIASFFTMQIMLYSTALYAGYFQGIDSGLKMLFQVIAMLLATPVIFYAGLPFIKNSLVSLKHRVLNMDILIASGSLTAYLYSIYAVFTSNEIYFDTASMIITLILFGRYIESGAKVKATKEISMLHSLQPSQAKILPDFEISRYIKGDIVPLVVSVDSIKRGDIVQILPGDKLPFDGVIVAGDTELNESMLTGEPLPVHKKEGDQVYSGSVNINGSIAVKVEKEHKESFLAQIVDSVITAQESSFNIKRLSDKAVSIFVPLVLAASLLSLVIWLSIGAGISESLMVAISVMVISCPCALGIAAPLALMISSSAAAREGIIIKDGTTLELFKDIKHLYLDKTGTITEGNPEITLIKDLSNGKYDLIKLVVSVERFSNHVIGKSIVKNYSGSIEEITNFNESAGKGVKGYSENYGWVMAGNISLMAEHGIEIDTNVLNLISSLSSNGETPVLVSAGNEIVGLIALRDKIKDGVEPFFDYFRAKGVKISVLTGDTKESAVQLLKSYSAVSNISGGLTPFGKADLIAEDKLHDKGMSSMVGDGINDAIALKASDIGIAMGSGAGISIDAAKCVILKSELYKVALLHKLSSKTVKIVKQNLFWSFIYNGLMIPLAMANMIHPIISASLMSISSLFVVFNSLRIRQFD